MSHWTRLGRVEIGNSGFIAVFSNHSQYLTKLSVGNNQHRRHFTKREDLLVDQLTRPKDKVEVYYFTEQPYGHVSD